MAEEVAIAVVPCRLVIKVTEYGYARSFVDFDDEARCQGQVIVHDPTCPLSDASALCPESLSYWSYPTLPW